MITTMAIVKVLGQVANIFNEGVPTTPGAVGDIYLDSATGLTYEWDGSQWEPFTRFDAQIELFIQRVESDYLRIRGIPFDTDENDDVIYPPAADVVAGEMVCYLLGLGDYEGRNLKSESVGGRNVSMDDKVRGYPQGIVDNIKRYARLL